MKATPFIILLGVTVALPANDKSSAPPDSPGAPMATSTVAPAPVETVDDNSLTQTSVLLVNWPPSPYINDYFNLKEEKYDDPIDEFEKIEITEEEKKEASKQHELFVQRQELMLKQIKACEIAKSQLLTTLQETICNTWNDLCSYLVKNIENRIGKEYYKILTSVSAPLSVPLGGIAYNIMLTEFEDIFNRYVQRTEGLTEVDIRGVHFKNYMTFVYLRLINNVPLIEALDEADKVDLLKATKVENPTPTTSVEAKADLPEGSSVGQGETPSPTESVETDDDFPEETEQKIIEDDVDD